MALKIKIKKNTLVRKIDGVKKTGYYGKVIANGTKSFEDIVKPKIGTVGSGEIEYHHQVLIIEFKDDGKTPARATYYIPTWEDIFADDWRLTQTADSFVLRMEDEIAEVEERAGKLCAFFKSPIFEKLSDKKKELMHEQYDAMILYSTKVGQRLELEKKGE